MNPSTPRWFAVCVLTLNFFYPLGVLRAQSDYSLPYAITTLAGSLKPYGSTDATGTNASFYTPYGVAVDSGGNVYVADTQNNKIRKVTAAGVVTTFAGDGSYGSNDGNGANASFYNPYGVAVDSGGNVYVADTQNNKIRKVTAAGVVTTLAGSGISGSTDATGVNASFSGPRGMAVDSSGNVYVADFQNNKIRKITAAGVVTTLAGDGSYGSTDATGTNASFSLPQGVAVDSSGNVYVAEWAGNKIRKVTAAGVVTTFAGSGQGGSTDATGTNASFYNPYGVAVDSGGNVYVADAANNKIRKVTAAGIVTTFAGSGQGCFIDATGTNASFYSPSGVAVDSGGNIYVADSQNNKIRKVSSGAVVTTLAGINSSQDGIGAAASFNQPSGVAVDSSGNIYVADAGNNKIRKVTAAGVVITYAGSGQGGSTDATGTNASFSGPSGVAVDSGGNVYVADAGNSKIRKVTAAGVVTTLAGSGLGGYTDATGTNASFSYPYGIAVDSSGNVYVAEYGANRIRKVTPAGVVTTLAGSGQAGSTDATGTNASFYYPRGVAVDSSGNVYVAEQLNNKVRKVTAAGVVTTLAGSGLGGYTDATGTNASFYRPYGVAVDSSGNVYVADSQNNKIRKVTAAGVVTSLAGSQGGAGNNDGVGVFAAFSSPYGVAVDGGGNIYVADTGNSRIRKGIALLTQTISFNSLTNRPYTTAGLVVTATTSSGLSPTVSYVSGPAFFSGNSLFLTGVGVVTLHASQAGDTNYAPAPSIDQSFTVTQGLQTITFGALANKTYGNPAFGVSATSSSLLAPAFSIVSGPATLSGSTLTLTGAGNVTVRASQSGNTNYLAATPVDQSFAVTQATQTITFGTQPNRIYGDAPFAVSATASSSLTPSFSIVSGPATIASNTITLTGAGTVAVRAAQAGNTNYLAATVVDRSFGVAKAAATVILSNLLVAYDGTPKAASATTLPVGLAVAFTYAGSSNSPTLGGNYALIGTINDSNYQGSASSTFVIGYTLHLSASHGTIAGATNGDIKPAGTVVTLSATPSVGYSFASWTGDVTGGTTRTNPLSVTMNGDKAITANFFQNLATPTNLFLSKTYFYDNVATGTVVGQFTATDADLGDFITYTLVAGPGGGDLSDRDNSRFSILNNDLKTSGTLFNYDAQRTQLIRIRATDLAGHSVETAFVLNLVDGTPRASFELKNGFTNAPSYVNVIFQLQDTNGNGINLPRELFDQANTIFQVKENGSAISPTESFAQVKKIDQVPAKVRTILLLDNSFSVGANLPTIKSAAKALVDSMFDQQEIAVYSFSGGYTLIKDFTSKSATNQQAIKTAIDTINLGSPSTDLYGTIIAMLNLPQWVESFSLAGIQTGFLIVLTDGSDTAGQATLSEVTTLRDASKKKIFTVGLGAEIDTNALISLGNAGYKPAAQVSAVATAFADIQNTIVDTANSYYWLNYASPKRGNFNRTLTVGLTNNANLGTNGTLTYIFNSSSFQDVAPGVMINRNVNLTYGVTNLTIPKDAATTAFAFTMLGFFGTPAYTWNAGNSNLVALAPLGTNGSSVTINPVGNDGTTTLTLIDTVNFYTNTIPLIIGTGIALPSQFITFAALADRATTSAAFNLSATASSGLPVSFSILSGPATLSSNTVTLAGVVGTVVVRATQAGNTNFAIATPVDRSFAVTVPGYNQIAPKILSGGQVRLAFVGNAGANYALDRSFKLSPPTWIPQVTNPADANGVLVFTNAPNASTNNFWRIRSVP